MMVRVKATAGAVKLTLRPLAADLWPALEDLFGRGGASNGCWCMYWRIGSLYRQRPRARNRAAFKRIVERGPPPGLLAFEGDQAVGYATTFARVGFEEVARRKPGRPIMRRYLKVLD
jgi:hypothetical protein